MRYSVLMKLRLLKLINTAGELNYLPTIAHESLSGIQKTMSLQPEPDTHPVPRVKAPWTVKATSWLMFLKLSSLPKGVYAPLDEVWARPEYGIFKGGCGAIMIVRYTDTPVGPYDELMLIPGNFDVPRPGDAPPKIPQSSLRITRIYVSQRTTAYNGRLNWNTPKRLARFSFSEDQTSSGAPPPQPLTVRVFPPGTSEGDGTLPFFSCTLTPWRWLPAIPINTAYLPMKTLFTQPPCSESPGQPIAVAAKVELDPSIDADDIDPKNEEAVLVGTARWCVVDLTARSRLRGCWVDVHKTEAENGEGVEGKYWPKELKVWSIGAWMEDGVFQLSEPLEWKN